VKELIVMPRDLKSFRFTAVWSPICMTAIHEIGRVNKQRYVQSVPQCWFLLAKAEALGWKTQLVNVTNNNFSMMRFLDFLSALTEKIAIEKATKRQTEL
jgi:hypothetical protein